MKKLSEINNETMLTVQTKEWSEFEVMSKQDFIESDTYVNRPYIEDSNYPEVTVAVKSIAKFNLEYALESLEDEMYEDWLASVMRDISKEDRERIENDINKYLEARPSYWEGEMVDIEE